MIKGLLLEVEGIQSCCHIEKAALGHADRARPDTAGCLVDTQFTDIGEEGAGDLDGLNGGAQCSRYRGRKTSCETRVNCPPPALEKQEEAQLTFRTTHRPLLPERWDWCVGRAQVPPPCRALFKLLCAECFFSLLLDDSSQTFLSSFLTSCTLRSFSFYFYSRVFPRLSTPLPSSGRAHPFLIIALSCDSTK